MAPGFTSTLRKTRLHRERDEAARTEKGKSKVQTGTIYPHVSVLQPVRKTTKSPPSNCEINAGAETKSEAHRRQTSRNALFLTPQNLVEPRYGETFKDFTLKHIKKGLNTLVFTFKLPSRLYSSPSSRLALVFSESLNSIQSDYD